MITNVQRLSENRYLINGAMVISDFDYQPDGVKYTLTYDDTIISESESEELANAFISDAINAIEVKLGG